MTIGLDISAELSTSLARLGLEVGRLCDANDDAAAERRRREMLRARVPADVRFITTGIVPGAAPRSLLTVGGPEAGYFWLVRRIVVGGLTWKTSAQGTVEVYVTGLAGNVGSVTTGPIVSALSLGDVVDAFATMPHAANYTSHQIIVQESENLSVVIDGGSGSQQYVMAAQVQVVRRATQADFATAS